MNPVPLRPATAVDAPACADILGDFCVRTPWLPRLHSPQEDRAFLNHLIARTDAWVAEDGKGDVAGYVARDGDSILHLYVQRVLRRSGIGTALLGLAQQGRTRLRLWCFQANTPALAFYARAGFTVARVTDGASNEERLPDAELIWRAG